MNMKAISLLNQINQYRNNCDLKILFMMETLHESMYTTPKIKKNVDVR